MNLLNKKEKSEMMNYLKERKNIVIYGSGVDSEKESLLNWFLKKLSKDNGVLAVNARLSYAMKISKDNEMLLADTHLADVMTTDLTKEVDWFLYDEFRTSDDLEKIINGHEQGMAFIATMQGSDYKELTERLMALGEGRVVTEKYQEEAYRNIIDVVLNITRGNRGQESQITILELPHL